ncbi:hypothetical protein [Paracoccus xiamenensis]|uniref:hypothetical protein n=1 Tax=Paracoccus xiamenensis TaxID=2714901 RepID=UPI00140AF0B6|nr:hypothetical protein [Paracoccus xiamenensis]NHF72103.1 hypothetical protein [Paracoccus xiamenensis]
MTTATGQAGKWRLAGLFLLIALPGLLLVWWFAIFNAALPQTAGGIVFTAVPVLAAAIVGALWRGTLPAQPDWATRRPYSRLMAYLLFAAATFVLPFAMAAIALKAEGHALIDAWPAILGLAGATLPRALPALFLSITFNFLICLIQTEIGLSLGVWIRSWAMRASANRA